MLIKTRGSKRVIVALTLPANCWSIKSTAQWPLRSKGHLKLQPFNWISLEPKFVQAPGSEFSDSIWGVRRVKGHTKRADRPSPKDWKCEKKVWKNRKEPPLNEKVAKASSLAITTYLRFQARKIHGQAIMGSGTEVLANAVGRSAWNQILLWVTLTQEAAASTWQEFRDLQGQLSQWQCILCCIQMLKLGQPYEQHMQQIRLMEMRCRHHIYTICNIRPKPWHKHPDTKQCWCRMSLISSTWSRTNCPTLRVDIRCGRSHNLYLTVTVTSTLGSRLPQIWRQCRETVLRHQQADLSCSHLCWRQILKSSNRSGWLHAWLTEMRKHLTCYNIDITKEKQQALQKHAHIARMTCSNCFPRTEQRSST